MHGHALAEPVLLQEGLGRHHFPISSNGAMAQRYFDQGLILSFGFNHAEAARSFQEAQKRDPNCAMCYWGEALVLGPNINAPMDPSVVPQAFAALEKAVALKGSGHRKRGRAHSGAGDALLQKGDDRSFPTRRGLCRGDADCRTAVSRRPDHWCFIR